MILTCKHTGRSKSCAHQLMADEGRGGATFINEGEPAERDQTLVVRAVCLSERSLSVGMPRRAAHSDRSCQRYKIIGDSILLRAMSEACWTLDRKIQNKLQELGTWPVSTGCMKTDIFAHYK